ncbi:hypothetical protein AFLA_013532 [Aspergillus flavus NRRL3357]|nr:hypothetical protein AFLA_013532 [Aspergillus flavus NRRL3357]
MAREFCYTKDSTDDIKTSIYHPSLVLCAQLENIVSRPAVDRLLRLVHPNVSGVTISVHCQVTMQVLSLLDLNISKQEETLQASLHTQMTTIGFICQQKRHVTESLAGSSPDGHTLVACIGKLPCRCGSTMFNGHNVQYLRCVPGMEKDNRTRRKRKHFSSASLDCRAQGRVVGIGCRWLLRASTNDAIQT